MIHEINLNQKEYETVITILERKRKFAQEMSEKPSSAIFPNVKKEWKQDETFYENMINKIVAGHMGAISKSEEAKKNRKYFKEFNDQLDKSESE